MPSPRPRVLHEAARIHHICWRRGSRLALAVRAQSAVTLRVGMVGGPQKSSAPYAPFLQRLEERGHQQGTNLAFDFIQFQKSRLQFGAPTATNRHVSETTTS